MSKQELEQEGIDKRTRYQIQEEWRKENTRVYPLRLNKTKDADITEWLHRQGEPTSTIIKRLIREKIEAELFEKDPKRVRFNRDTEKELQALPNEELKAYRDSGSVGRYYAAEKEISRRFFYYMKLGLLPRSATAKDTYRREDS